ncbi:MAG: c-type cytochrome biogenesis protein CcmI [Acidocella sp.]|nr:c-type cytochrome biogenesis protein CcmI [Acidocella sp.]
MIERRIGPAEHAIAILEVERRALAEAALPEPEAGGNRAPLFALLGLLPGLALVFYLVSHPAPGLPDAPLAAREAEAARGVAQAKLLEARLRAKISELNPQSDQARQGYMLLGNLQDTEGNLQAAAGSWSAALSIRFDATLAAELAEAQTRIAGKVTPEAAALFRRALAAAPQNAPWRAVVEQRLGTATPANTGN